MLPSNLKNIGVPLSQLKTGETSTTPPQSKIIGYVKPNQNPVPMQDAKIEFDDKTVNANSFTLTPEQIKQRGLDRKPVASPNEKQRAAEWLQQVGIRLITDKKFSLTSEFVKGGEKAIDTIWPATPRKTRRDNARDRNFYIARLSQEQKDKATSERKTKDWFDRTIKAGKNPMFELQKMQSEGKPLPEGITLSPQPISVLPESPHCVNADEVSN
jgi:hypothetical protein